MLKKAFQTLFFRVPADIRKEFGQELSKVNVQRAKITSLLLILLEMFMPIFFIVNKRQEILEYPNVCYIGMYLLMLFAMGIFFFLFNKMGKDIESSLKGIHIAGVAFTTFILLWCALISLLDQLSWGQGIVYASAVIAVAVFPFFGPVKLLAMLMSVQTVYVLIMLGYQNLYGGSTVNIINSSVNLLLSWFISRVLYRSKYLEFMNGVMIKQKNDELNELNNELVEANKKLEYLSFTDSLTGLYNRRKLEELLDKEWNRCKRHGIPFSLLMIDVDNFKSFNDLFGHPAGDEYLIHISSLLKKSVRRSSDIIARYGGEEFVVALPHLGRDEAYIFAERIRSDVEKHLLKWNESGTEHVITISVGLCTVIPSDAFSVDDLIYSADKALYKAKIQKNRTTFIDIVKADERPLLTLADEWEAMGI